MPSPYNAQGFGYRRSIKPDVLFPGGRLLIQESLRRDGAPTRVEMMGTVTRSPGQRVAAPSGNVLTPAVSYTRGTSNACAMATRNAAQIFDTLSTPGGVDSAIPDEFLAVTLKALSYMAPRGEPWGPGMNLL